MASLTAEVKKALLDKAIAYRKMAYIPYSKYAVGAAVLAIWGQELGLFGATDKPFFARGFVGDKAADDACAGGGF